MEDKAIQEIFIGYDSRFKGYKIYTGEKNLAISKIVKLFETIPIF